MTLFANFVKLHKNVHLCNFEHLCILSITILKCFFNQVNFVKGVLVPLHSNPIYSEN